LRTGGTQSSDSSNISPAENARCSFEEGATRVRQAFFQRGLALGAVGFGAAVWYTASGGDVAKPKDLLLGFAIGTFVSAGVVVQHSDRLLEQEINRPSAPAPESAKTPTDTSAEAPDSASQ
jgi:hypothetical protein